MGLSTIRRCTVPLLAVAVLVAGCSDGTSPASGSTSAASTGAPTPGDCTELAAAIADTVQRYVDQFAGLSSDELLGPAAPRSEVNLGAEAERLGAHGEGLGCERDMLDELIAAELGRLRGEGAAAEAVAAAFRDQLLDAADPSLRPPEERRVASERGLATALATLGPGSTIVLDAGEYHFNEPLVILRPIALVGAGRDDTRIVSSASDAAIVYLGEGELRLEDLAVAHEGRGPAAVVVVREGSYRMRGIRVAGGRATSEGAGGFGLVLRSTDPREATPGRRQLEDTEVVDNGGGGIAVAGADRPAIGSSVIRDNGRCGVCYVERAGGTLRATLLAANDVGVRIDEDAAPTVAANEIEDSAEAGIQVVGTSAATIRGNVVAGETPVGILAADQATPEVVGNELANDGENGLVYAGDAAGRGIDNEVSGQRIGVQAGDDARPRLIGNRIRASEDAALVLAGSSGGQVEATVCQRSPLGIVLLESTDPELVDNDCDVHDERD